VTTPTGSIRSIVIDDGTLFVGGWFDRMAGQPRSRLASFDIATGDLTSWQPDPIDGSVAAIAVLNSTIYVGGYFDSIDEKPQSGFAAFAEVVPVELQTLSADWNRQPPRSRLSLGRLGSNWCDPSCSCIDGGVTGTITADGCRCSAKNPGLVARRQPGS